MRSQYQLYLSWQRHSWAKVIDCFHLHLSSNTHPSCLMHKHNQLYWHTHRARDAHTSCTHPSTPHSDYVQLHTHHAPIHQPLTLTTYSCTHIMHPSINPSLWARTVAHTSCTHLSTPHSEHVQLHTHTLYIPHNNVMIKYTSWSCWRSLSVWVDFCKRTLRDKIHISSTPAWGWMKILLIFNHDAPIFFGEK